MEQEEYTKEEINWSYIEFVDNHDVLDLIEKVCLIYFSNLFGWSCTDRFSIVLSVPPIFNPIKVNLRITVELVLCR